MKINSLINFFINNKRKKKTNKKHKILDRANIETAAWNKGQIGSKLWLCDIFEKHYPFRSSSNIWILGGWYGILSFLLLSRGNIPIKEIVSIDINSYCEEIANKINEYWIWKNNIFKAYTADCNKLSYTKNKLFEQADIIISTSTEHMIENEWFENIPDGKFIIIQSTDMKDDQHVNLVSNESELLAKHPLSKLIYKGNLFFDFKNKWSFHRFMIMGFK